MKVTQAETTSTRTFGAGALLFREGDAGGDLWIIREGTVEVYRERNGKRLHLARLSEGEMLGTMTIMSGGQRTASARALSPVVITIIPKEQMTKVIGDMPKWATTFMNDLVARVQYANDLYVEGESASTSDIFGPLNVAVQLAEAIVALADVFVFSVKQQENQDPIELVDLNRLLERVTSFLGKRGDFAAMLAIFIEHQLLSLVANDRNIMATSLADMRGLKQFAKVIKDLAGRQEGQDQLIIPFAQGERASLRELAKFGAKQQVTTEGTVVLFAPDLERAMIEALGNDYKSYVLSQAQEFDYLTIQKNDEPPSISFNPSVLTLIVSSLEAAVAINKGNHKGQPKKKSLTY